MGRVDPPSLSDFGDGHLDLSLQILPLRAGRLEARIGEICETCGRYDYRRVHVLLRCEGWTINMQRTHRIYNELVLQLRNKTSKRRVKAKLREDRREVSCLNETWAKDFVHDQLATGRKIRVLTVLDTFCRFSPVLDPRFSYRGEDVVHTLELTCAVTGDPKTLRVDQGSEFISRDLDLWVYAKSVTLDCPWITPSSKRSMAAFGENA